MLLNLYKAAYQRLIDKKMVNWLRQMIAKVRKKEFDCKYGRSRIEKGYTKIVKKVTTNVQLMEGGR